MKVKKNKRSWIRITTKIWHRQRPWVVNTNFQPVSTIATLKSIKNDSENIQTSIAWSCRKIGGKKASNAEPLSSVKSGDFTFFKSFFARALTLPSWCCNITFTLIGTDETSWIIIIYLNSVLSCPKSTFAPWIHARIKSTVSSRDQRKRRYFSITSTSSPSLPVWSTSSKFGTLAGVVSGKESSLRIFNLFSNWHVQTSIQRRRTATVCWRFWRCRNYEAKVKIVNTRRDTFCSHPLPILGEFWASVTLVG